MIATTIRPGVEATTSGVVSLTLNS